MSITEATALLAPYGVERIERSAYKGIGTILPEGTPVWKVYQGGKVYIYCAPLDRLVWALTPEAN
jgi:hypothetical protein